MGINFYESVNFKISYKIFPVLGNKDKMLIYKQIISAPQF